NPLLLLLLLLRFVVLFLRLLLGAGILGFAFGDFGLLLGLLILFLLFAFVLLALLCGLLSGLLSGFGLLRLLSILSLQAPSLAGIVVTTLKHVLKVYEAVVIDPHLLLHPV